jgi:hypothetical protein
MFISRLATWATGITLMIGAACSSSEEQPEQSPSMPQEQASAPQASTSQPAETASEMATSTETTPPVSDNVAETKAKPAASEEYMTPQQAPASGTIPMKTAPQMTLGPNMIRVNASIVNTEGTGNSYICTLNIEQILGSGPSTPSLVRGNEIKVRIKKVVGQSEKMAVKGGNIEVTLQHTPPLASIQPPPAWNVMEVH